jgi:predicted Zn-dependent peptidase
VDFRVDVGTFDITASVGLQSAEPFLREILAILADLKVNGPTPSEMERVTSRTLVDVELLPSAPASIAFDLAWAALNHQKSSLKTRHQTAAKLSVDTLRKCAQETFLPGKASLVLLGPEDDALRARLLNAMIHGF